MGFLVKCSQLGEDFVKFWQVNICTMRILANIYFRFVSLLAKMLQNSFTPGLKVDFKKYKLYCMRGVCSLPMSNHWFWVLASAASFIINKYCWLPSSTFPRRIARWNYLIDTLKANRKNWTFCLCATCIVFSITSLNFSESSPSCYVLLGLF